MLKGIDAKLKRWLILILKLLISTITWAWWNITDSAAACSDWCGESHSLLCHWLIYLVLGSKWRVSYLPTCPRPIVGQNLWFFGIQLVVENWTARSLSCRIHHCLSQESLVSLCFNSYCTLAAWTFSLHFQNDTACSVILKMKRKWWSLIMTGGP